MRRQNKLTLYSEFAPSHIYPPLIFVHDAQLSSQGHHCGVIAAIRFSAHQGYHTCSADRRLIYDVDPALRQMEGMN